METIGFVELNSIAKGIEAADQMLKAAEVKLLFARPGCPGKYYVLISGQVAAVEASIAAGSQTGGAYVIEQTVIPRVHPEVIAAFGSMSVPKESEALGILEFFGVTASIAGADAAVKAADVTLLEIRLGTGIGGKSFIALCGDVAAVEESVKCGAEAGGDGLLLSRTVIPSPSQALFEALL